jgi:hypothetical protein
VPPADHALAPLQPCPAHVLPLGYGDGEDDMELATGWAPMGHGLLRGRRSERGRCRVHGGGEEGRSHLALVVRPHRTMHGGRPRPPLPWANSQWLGQPPKLTWAWPPASADRRSHQDSTTMRP